MGEVYSGGRKGGERSGKEKRKAKRGEAGMRKGARQRGEGIYCVKSNASVHINFKTEAFSFRVPQFSLFV